MASATNATLRAAKRASWFSMIKQTASEWTDDDTMTWAAAVACYTVLALAPLLVIAIKVLAVFLSGKAAGQQLQSQIVNWMGPATGQAFQEIISRASQKATPIATIVSLVIAIISAGGVFGELQHAMNRIWKVKPKPGRAIWGFLRSRIMSILVVGVSVLILLASVAVTTWLGHFTSELGPVGKWITWIVDVVVSVGVLTLLFGIFYREVPDAQIHWRTTWVGAVMSAVLFEIGKYALALYFRFAAPASPYGAVGSLAAVLIWIYYSTLIVFFGAEFTQVFAKMRGHGVRPSKHAQTLSQCNETETATPSAADPGYKPERPAKPRATAAFREDYAIAQRAGIGDSQQNASNRVSRTTAAFVAAGGLAVGAFLGGLGAIKGGFVVVGPSSQDIASTKLRQRLRQAERKVSRASRLNRYLQADDVTERVAALERQVCASPRSSKHDGTRTNRVVETVKSYL